MNNKSTDKDTLSLLLFIAVFCCIYVIVKKIVGQLGSRKDTVYMIYASDCKN